MTTKHIRHRRGELADAVLAEWLLELARRCCASQQVQS
jgi:hypothetical protein